MSQLTYSFVGVNKRQLEASIDNLRNSPTFRQLEADASQRYDHAIVVMGPDINPTDRTGLHRLLAVSGGSADDRRKLYIFLDTKTSATRPTPSGDEALTVDQLIAHEMAHATFPPQPLGGYDLGGAPSPKDDEEEKAAVQLGNQVSADLGMRGIRDDLRLRRNPGPLSTFRDPYAADPSILKFGDGTRADVGDGPLDGAPTAGQAIFGIKRLRASDDGDPSPVFSAPAFGLSSKPSLSTR